MSIKYLLLEYEPEPLLTYGPGLKRMRIKIKTDKEQYNYVKIIPEDDFTSVFKYILQDVERSVLDLVKTHEGTP